MSTRIRTSLLASSRTFARQAERLGRVLPSVRAYGRCCMHAYQGTIGPGSPCFSFGPNKTNACMRRRPRCRCRCRCATAVDGAVFGLMTRHDRTRPYDACMLPCRACTSTSFNYRHPTAAGAKIIPPNLYFQYEFSDIISVSAATGFAVAVP